MRGIRQAALPRRGVGRPRARVPRRRRGATGVRLPGTCNDQGKNPVVASIGFGRWNWSSMNDGELNQLGGTLAKTGMHEGCTNGYGVFDMVGNLHEWVADPDGTFYGGYYADVSSVGDGEGCGTSPPPTRLATTTTRPVPPPRRPREAVRSPRSWPFEVPPPRSTAHAVRQEERASRGSSGGDPRLSGRP